MDRDRPPARAAAGWIGLVLGLSLGCTPPEPAKVDRIRPAAVAPPEGSPPKVAMPGPAQARGEEAARINAGCEACHQEEAEQWRHSLHQRANVEPTYRRAFAIEPQPFCRSCHAPEADPMVPPSEAVSHLGVGCVTCHLRGEAVLAALTPRSTEPAPHAVLRDERFDGPQACAGCHEFPFPTALSREDGAMMQTTMREHARSPAADRACASCHMPPDRRGRPSHGFVASRDAEVVRSAVEIAAERLDARRVRVTLTPRISGHAFPTGDLFRRVEVSAEAVGVDHMIVAADRRYLARHFALRDGHVGRQLVRDDRVFFEPVTIELALGDEAVGRRVAWRVAYQRVAHPVGEDTDAAEIDGEVVLGWGWLAPTSSDGEGER